MYLAFAKRAREDHTAKKRNMGAGLLAGR